jgi:hypothetical protein
MSSIKLPFKPGVYKDDTPLEAKGYWIDTDKIRFVRGLPETIYGWERATTSLLNGITRGGMTWGTNARVPYAAFGTHLQLYVMDGDGNVTNITPYLSYGQVTNKITTTAGTATTVNITAHGMVATQVFTVLSQASAVGGITLSGDYPVTSVTDADNFVITTATATAAGPGGGILNYAIGLVPGQTDGLAGLGYGTGGYGSGGYSGSGTGYTLYPATWALSQWGQNLIANPRGGGIYEWAPNVSSTELNTDTTFSTNWTIGANWSVTAGVAAASTASTAISTTCTLQPGAWHLLQFDLVRSSGTLQPSVAATNQGSALSTTGHKAIDVFSGAGGTVAVALTGAAFTGNVQNVSLKVKTVATAITNAPTQVTCAFVTSERILVACGCINSNSVFDAMQIRWTDTQNNQTWPAANLSANAANLSGGFVLTNGSRIVRGLPGTTENTIHTDTALYGMVYNGDPTSVYSFPERGSGCGLIGPNAVTQLGGVTYWMDPNIGFWHYAGGFPASIPCTLSRDVRDNIAWVQQDKVYCFPVTVAGRLEVWWLYPDSRDGVECSRYISYHVTESIEQGAPVWANGTFNRTTWTGTNVFQYPLSVDTAGQVWFQEKGFTQDGGPRTWSATSAYFDLSDKGDQMRLTGIEPDVEDQQGNYQITVNTKIRNSSGIVSRSKGPYNVMSTTGNVNFRTNGEEAQFVFGGTAGPCFWRLGAFRYHVETSGRTR